MPSPDRVAFAHERLAARARRVRLIRQRIVAATLATFVLAWGVVVFDGSMGAPASTVTAQRRRLDDGDRVVRRRRAATMTTSQS